MSISLFLGVLAGWLVLKEPNLKQKLAGSVIIFLGTVIIVGLG